jgi:hypothetical protein
MMDRLQQLAWDSPLCAAVVGKGDDFVLLPLEGLISEAAKQDAAKRELQFCGVVGLRDGSVEVEMESPVDQEALRIMARAVASFTERFAPRSDGVDWLERLYQLPDPRG